jgi:hypothetical protein
MHRKITKGTNTFTEYALTYVASEKHTSQTIDKMQMSD